MAEKIIIEEGDASHRNEEEETPIFSKDSMDISEQIGRALETFSPHFVRKMNETMEGAMHDHIARMIKEEVANAVQEEFVKKDGKGKEKEGETIILGDDRSGKTSSDKHSYKEFTLCNPATYEGETNPIVVTRWISEIEGHFRTSKCPEDSKVTYAISMLRGYAKRWWDGMRTIMKDAIDLVGWTEFKVMFFKEFRSEAEVTKLRGEFLNEEQGLSSVNEFKVKFLDKAQFCPEFLENDVLLKEQFFRKLRKSLRERISLRQMTSFAMLVDVAKDHEIEQAMVGDGSGSKRKVEESSFPNKHVKTMGGFSDSGVGGSGVGIKSAPFCDYCKRNHTGVCRYTPNNNCYTCGKPGHISRNCKAEPFKSVVCYKCYKEGHIRSYCPMLSEEERMEERRKEAERRNARNIGNQQGRSYQLIAEEARDTFDDVTGIFSL
jgi:hypothetical protein